ncbi:pleckstrin domain-containing protein [Dioszegia hungarica]|uniref:Pleckstrin homology domain-containing protein n=1 Tax=Dioszegia hungarica TaxID=4972 RepID=A0AA38HBA1_9TREE|nr:pleckstrin domain-containing protein [Dioszegia hungarica]KAI9636770.1 Pleckstrin homology domain-containing protein [Dioszegia hungarica]
MVGEGDDDDEEKCPICVESLSFSYRLPGEKPHVVPECGHALHEECFVTVYGEVPTYGSKRNIGLCGVCRQKMRIVDGGGERKRSKGKKLDMLMGATSTPPLRAIPSYPSLSSYQSPSSPSDPYGDDPVDLAQITSSSRSFVGESQPKVVVPTISIRAEFASTTRRQNKPTTAMVTIEVPHAGDRGRYPATRMIDSLRSPSMMNSPRLPGSPGSFASHDITHSPKSGPSAAPFSHVEAELKHRVLDYKNSGLDTLGPLRLYDMIAVRKGSMLREFLMYLYNDALICISEEKPNAFQKIFSSSSSMRSTDTKSSTGTGSGRGPLKLRGRIYVKHVKKLVDSSVPSEFSITILMENEGMESFILTFKDKGSHETWRSTLQQIVDEAKQPATSAKGGNSANKIARLMGSGAPPPAPGGSSRGGKAATTPGLPSSSSMGFGPTFSDFGSPSTVDQHSPDRRPSAGDLVNNAPLAPIHTPLDLVIVLSIPASPPGASAPLKLRLMRQSLAFVFALLGSKDRVSIVSCEMGTSIRKTPLLNPTKYESRRRLEEFVEAIGAGSTPGDESEVQTQPDERCDVVTAINVSLDVILQRKAKNPLTGLILISDTNEVAKRAQMDLVCARLDAANVPVHSLGYGKAHDPTPLWMVSNHTQGTYTFVREWYHLRDALAGVIGGLMTIALTNMKLHLSAQENEFRIVKVTGTPQAIGSASGKTLDIELKELRFGERREILVEVELIGNGSSRNSGESGDGSRPGPRRSPSLINGMDSMSVGDANSALREMVYEESMVDEVPVIEVDCSFHDPAIGRSVSRLAHPVLLTLAILPTLSSPGNQYSDPTVQRRKMELIASDMLTRSLLLVSRRNFSQANKLLGETRKIVRTISEGIQGNIPAGGKARTKKEVASVQAVAQLDNIVGDMDALCEALDENPELFGKDQRNFASQQGIVLRSQRSWTTKTGTEAWYCTDDVRRIIQISGEWGVKG